MAVKIGIIYGLSNRQETVAFCWSVSPIATHQARKAKTVEGTAIIGSSRSTLKETSDASFLGEQVRISGNVIVAGRSWHTGGKVYVFRLQPDG